MCDNQKTKSKQQLQLEKQEWSKLFGIQKRQSIPESPRLLDHETFVKRFKRREQSDAELIEDYKCNYSQAAFEKLYKRHKSKMLAYLYGILHNWEDAKDVLHNSWEVVLLYFNKRLYKEEQDFTGWFKGICYHRASEWLRDKRRFFYGNENLPDHADTSYNAEGRLENSQCEALLQNALKQLSDKERKVVILHAIENRSFYEISVLMNMKANVARAVYSRAVKELKLAVK